MTGAPFVLYYWPEFPGRGEYIRLVLEFAEREYEEVNKIDELMTVLESKENDYPHFALPCLKLPNGSIISQTPNILMVLAKTLKLAGDGSDKAMMHINQFLLTILDLVLEAHDTHHPIGSGLYYEDQKAEASRRAKDFRTTRLPKFLTYFEDLLHRNKSHPHLYGDSITVADLALFHTLRGVEFAFPKCYRASVTKCPHVEKFVKYMNDQEAIKRYLAQPTRLPFKDGLFRHYTELDE